MIETSFTTSNRQGPLPSGFQINLNGDYIVLVGKNNAAKSSLLQAIFRRNQATFSEKGTTQTCLLLPERIFTELLMQGGNRTLEVYNHDLATIIGEDNRNYQHWGAGPNPAELPRLLLTHDDLVQQVLKLGTLLEYFNLPPLKVGSGQQQITFENISATLQGSGLRSIFSILAALTDDHVKLLLIDEPELSLEPRLQKLLRDLFYQYAGDKTIIVTTHSHLFLNRREYTSNYVVTKSKNNIQVEPVASEGELYQITFNLLGSSAEDLFFPNNFLIVEGATDQTIAEKIMELKGIDRTKLKVVSASGIDNIENKLNAVCNSVLTFLVSDSPYKNRIVALIDKPNEVINKPSKGGKPSTYDELRKALPDRLFNLDAESLEDFFPEELYTRCDRVKEDDLRKIKEAKDHLERKRLKTVIATAIASKLIRDDLPTFKPFVDAIEKAIV